MNFNSNTLFPLEHQLPFKFLLKLPTDALRPSSHHPTEMNKISQGLCKATLKQVQAVL